MRAVQSGKRAAPCPNSEENHPFGTDLGPKGSARTWGGTSVVELVERCIDSGGPIGRRPTRGTGGGMQSWLRPPTQLQPLVLPQPSQT